MQPCPCLQIEFGVFAFTATLKASRERKWGGTFIVVQLCMFAASPWLFQACVPVSIVTRQHLHLNSLSVLMGPPSSESPPPQHPSGGLTPVPSPSVLALLSLSTPWPSAQTWGSAWDVSFPDQWFLALPTPEPSKQTHQNRVPSLTPWNPQQKQELQSTLEKGKQLEAWSRYTPESGKRSETV